MITFALFSALATFYFTMFITPGPNNAMLTTSGLKFGFFRTLPHVIGIPLGHIFQIGLTCFGLANLFLIYPQGNFIEVSQDNPFFQIGETKYGKPILVRGYDYEMGFSDAVKLMLLSFDSTIKANLSVGFPLDLHIYKDNSFKAAEQKFKLGVEAFLYLFVDCRRMIQI